MKRLLCLLLAFTLCIQLSACTSEVNGNPQDVIAEMLNDFKNQNFDEVEKYFAEEVNFADALTFEGKLENIDTTLAKTFIDRITDIDFEILDSTIENGNNKSSVTVKITTHNIGEKIVEGIKVAAPLAVQLTFSKEDAISITNQVLNALLSPVQDSTKSITKTITIDLKNVNGEWMISPNNIDLLNTISGGFEDLSEQFNFLK